MLMHRPRVILYDPMREHGQVEPPPATMLDRALEALLPDRPPRRQVLRTDNPREMLAWIPHARNWTIALDEAHNLWHEYAREFEAHMRLMRHRGQDWFLISHRVQWTPLSIVSQVDRLIVGHMTLRADLDKLANDFGLDSEAVIKLKTGEAIGWQAHDPTRCRRLSPAEL